MELLTTNGRGAMLMIMDNNIEYMNGWNDGISCMKHSYYALNNKTNFFSHVQTIVKNFESFSIQSDFYSFGLMDSYVHVLRKLYRASDYDSMIDSI